MDLSLTETEHLVGERDAIKARIMQLGDMRAGSLVPRYRKCGKPNCHCARDGSKGHGPSWSLTRAKHGKTQTRVIPEGPALVAVKEQLAEYRLFRELIRELVDVNERICDAKLKSSKAEATAKKGASNPRLRRKSSAN